jgi:hypothetical protein
VNSEFKKVPGIERATISTRRRKKTTTYLERKKKKG